MAEIAETTEESLDYSRYFVRDHMKMEHTVANAVCASAYSAASYLDAEAIVVVTKSGRTARMDTPEALFDYALKKAKETGLVHKGSIVIVVTSSDIENNNINDVMRICKI